MSPSFITIIATVYLILKVLPRHCSILSNNLNALTEY